MKLAPALVCLAAVSAHGYASTQNSPELVVGVYHWGGSAATSMSQGVARIAELGGRAARVTLSARYYTDYNVASGCYPDFSLTALAREPDVREALGNKLVNTVMLTAYDGVTFGDCHTHLYLQPAFYTPRQRAAIIQEYSDFTLYLYETYKDSGKRFIISNWEADNAVYCGAAQSYATDRGFRHECDSVYASTYGNTSPEESLRGLQLWFEAREAGISDGRNRARTNGLGGVAVHQAPEISVIHALRDAGLRSVLYDVLPASSFEHVSYSSYESINQPDAAMALRTDIEEIRAVAGAPQVIIGEFGFSRSTWGAGAATRAQTAITAAASAGIQLMFYWQLFDQDARNDYGLCDASGGVTTSGIWFQRMSSHSAAGVRRSPLPRRRAR